LQNLYKDRGWGSENYDGEEMEGKREELFGRLEKLEKQAHNSRRIAQAQMGDVGAAKEDLTAARPLFWAENADANAM
jgi:hypothetical protein